MQGDNDANVIEQIDIQCIVLHSNQRSRENQYLEDQDQNSTRQLQHPETKALLQNSPMPDAVSVLVRDRDGGE
jgi:hypothetical protein